MEGGNRDPAMRLMIEEGSQEEREAAAKWVRAQRTAAQLATYFVGFQKHTDLRNEAEEKWGDKFNRKQHNDKVISFGSPPVRQVRALLFDEEIPR